MLKIKNNNGYIILIVSRDEQQKINGRTMSVCDSCNNPIERNGYIIPVLNRMYCSKCTKEFEDHGQFYVEDVPVEEANYNYYCNLLGGK